MKPLMSLRQQRGTALVELAIVIPLLLFLLLGIAEFGNAFNQYNTLTKTVRDGARYAAGKVLEDGSTGVIPPELDSSFISNTQNMVAYGLPSNTGSPVLPGLSASDVTVTRLDAYHIQVSASYSYVPLLGEGASLPSFGIGDGGSLSLAFTFQASIVMRAI